MCHNAFPNPPPTQSPNCFGSPAPGLTGNVFLSSDAVQTWYDAVYLQAQRPYSQASHWGAGLTYTWAKGTQTGGDLFSFDYRFPTDYPRYSSPNVQRRSEEHTSELQSRLHLVCRLLLEKKKPTTHHLRAPLSNVVICD